MNKKLFIAGLFLIILTGFCKCAQAITVKFDQEVTDMDGKIYTSTVWIKGEKTRIENDFKGAKNIMLISADGCITYTEGQPIAMNFGAEGIKKYSMDELKDYHGYLEKVKAKKIGEELVDEYICDIYTYEEPNTNIKVKMWVWKPKTFPVKYETNTPYGTIMSTYKNIQIDTEISDDMFELPPGVTVIKY